MAAIPFHFHSWSNDTSIKVVVVSFYPDTPTVTCSGGSLALGSRVSVGTGDPALADTGDSHSQETTGSPTGVACFSWIATITSLTSDTQYTLSVTQNGTTRTGSSRTQLDSNDTSEFSFFYIACDGRDVDGSENGCWSYIRDYAENNKVTAVVHTDDHGYSDGLSIANTDGNLRWCTASAQSATGSAGYDYKYGVMYCAYLGLLENTAAVSQQGDAFLEARFQSEDRQWCSQNIPKIVTPGDHEIYNNTEEQSLTAAHFSAVKSVWTNTLGAGQSFIDSANSVATRDVLGPVEVICPDRVFGLTALTPVVDANKDPTGASWLGANQKSDLRGAADSTSPFKVFGMSMSIRHIISKAQQDIYNGQAAPDDWGYATMGSQQPLHDYTLSGSDSDYTDVFTSETEGGIFTAFDHDYTPTVVMLHGDTHRPYNYYHYEPATAGYAASDFYEISCGSVDGQPMHGLHTSVINGYQYSPVTVTWLPDFTTRNATYNPDANDIAAGYEPDANISTCLRVDVRKTGSSWAMSIHTIRCSGDDSSGDVIRTVDLDSGVVNAPAYLRSGTI